jgi:hypothetical protein
MRKLIAFATLQLACWLGRIGFRAAGKDMRESLVALQIVPTPERAEREMAEWLRGIKASHSATLVGMPDRSAN